MEQLVIILLIALISFINWLVKKSAELREARKREQGAAKSGESLRSEPPPPPEAEPEISMRRLREALGLPDEAQPPALPKRMEQRVPPPSIATAAACLLLLQGRSFLTFQSSRAHEEHRLFELPHRIGKPASPKVEVAATSSRIRELLGSAGGLRDAVVLSEILGPPKCLRAAQGQFLK